MISVRSASKVVAYFSIGFVLIFLGKISKAELFHNYTRSISGINDRNSQDIRHALTQQLQFSQTVVTQVRTQLAEAIADQTFFSKLYLSFRPESVLIPTGNEKIVPTPAIFLFSRPSMAP